MILGLRPTNWFYIISEYPDDVRHHEGGVIQCFSQWVSEWVSKKGWISEIPKNSKRFFFINALRCLPRIIARLVSKVGWNSDPRTTNSNMTGDDKVLFVKEIKFSVCLTFKQDPKLLRANSPNLHRIFDFKRANEIFSKKCNMSFFQKVHFLGVWHRKLSLRKIGVMDMSYIMDSGQNSQYTTFPNIFLLISADSADLLKNQKNHIFQKNVIFWIENLL